jgi:hypothetical protein
MKNISAMLILAGARFKLACKKKSRDGPKPMRPVPQCPVIWLYLPEKLRPDFDSFVIIYYTIGYPG